MLQESDSLYLCWLARQSLERNSLRALFLCRERHTVSSLRAPISHSCRDLPPNVTSHLYQVARSLHYGRLFLSGGRSLKSLMI